MSRVPTDRSELPIRRAAEGDEEAFAVILRRMRPLISAQIAAFPALAFCEDDVRQECLVGLLSAVRTYRPDGGAAFTTYATTCIRRRLISLSRQTGARLDREQSLGEEDPADEEEDPADRTVEREAVARLRALAQSRLTPLEYRVLTARLDGLPYAEIARRLGITVKAVDNAVQRLRRKFSADSP